MRILHGIILSVVLTAVSWNCGDAHASSRRKETREILDSPGVVEKFKKSQGRQTERPQDKESPLVKEAKSFALFLNPPQPKVKTPPPRVDTRTKSIVKAPTNVSATFKVVGTSASEADPSMSLALLDIAGKGLRWIRQGESVGHLVIEEVKPGGTIVVRDGRNTSEMTVDRPVKVSLLRDEQPGLSSQVQAMASASSDAETSTARRTIKPAPAAAAPRRGAPVILSEEQRKQQEQMMAELMVQVGEMFKVAGEAPGTAGEKDEDQLQQQEQMSQQIMERMGKVLAPADTAPETDGGNESSTEIDEKPQVEISDIETVDDISEAVKGLSERLELLKSDAQGSDVQNIEKSIHRDVESFKNEISKTRATQISPEDKNKLNELEKDLANIQQELRRVQSRRRIEQARDRTRR